MTKNNKKSKSEKKEKSKKDLAKETKKLEEKLKEIDEKEADLEDYVDEHFSSSSSFTPVSEPAAPVLESSNQTQEVITLDDLETPKKEEEPTPQNLYNPNIYDERVYETSSSEPEVQIERAMRRQGLIQSHPVLDRINPQPRTISMSNPELEESRTHDEYVVRETERIEQDTGVPPPLQKDRKYRPMKA